jgi:hypothetical protein
MRYAFADGLCDRWKARRHIRDKTVRTLIFSGARRLERRVFSCWRKLFLDEERLRNVRQLSIQILSHLLVMTYTIIFLT